MGKRQRRRVRETVAASQAQPRRKDDLGAPGPYMVCGVCNVPLNAASFVSRDADQQEELIGYIHSLEYLDSDGRVVAAGKDYDHMAVPVIGNPIDADGPCDFCHAPDPRWVFVPRRPVQMLDEMTGNKLDYSSPWSCCDGCLPIVKSKNITRMLDRAWLSPYNLIQQMPSHLQSLYRAQVRAKTRELYSRYLKSDPAGPYELKIRPAPRPVGKRGSLKGM